MKKMRDILKDRLFMKYGVFIILTATLLYIIYTIIQNINNIASFLGGEISSILTVLTPLFIGIVIAYLFTPFIKKVENSIMKRLIRDSDNKKKNKIRQKRRRVLSVLVAYLFILLIITAILYTFVSLVVGQIVIKDFPSMIKSAPEYIKSYEATLRTWINQLPSDILSTKLQGLADSLLQWLGNNVKPTALFSTVKSTVGSIASFIIGIVISIYLAADKEYFIKLWNRFIRLFATDTKALSINKTLNDVNNILSQFLRGMLLDALIVAILSSIGLSLLGLKFAVFLGIFAGACNVIPYFGPILGMIPAVLVGIMSGELWQAGLAIVILLVIQQIDGNIIYPRIVGSTTGLHPLFVLLAVIIGGKYGGLGGMILAVPIAGVIQLFVSSFVFRRERKLGLPKEDLEE